MVKIWWFLYYLACLSKFTVASDDEDGDDYDEPEFSPTSPAPLSETAPRAENPEKKEVYCDNFSEYALNCTINAAIMYNSNRKSPPMPNKIYEWCNAVRYLTSCAREWNANCRDFSDSHFNDESINGHSYVVHNICDDKNFKQQYSEISVCVENIADQWEKCYSTFKNLVDGYKKNTTVDWTHYETHFYLCCGRATFRRCVLETVFKRSDVCNRSQAIILQKFSVIVSEGDVYQDCEFNMLYSNCPGGDPRPQDARRGLQKFHAPTTHHALGNAEDIKLTNTADRLLLHNVVLFLLWLNIITIHVL